MRRYTFIAILLLATMCTNAQSINLADLVSLNTLSNQGAESFLVSNNRFKLMNIQEVNGLPVCEFQNVRGEPHKLETITIGNGVKNADGQLLRTVTYNSALSNYIIALIAQAPGDGFNCYFRGNDRVYNIYLYDNPLYSLNIYLKLDESSGYLEIKQKEAFPAF